jgi:hypothetical protein
MTVTIPVEIGQTVWFIENNLVRSGELLKIEIAIETKHRSEQLVGFRYTILAGKPIEPLRTNRCYPTKAELLASL